MPATYSIDVDVTNPQWVQYVSSSSVVSSWSHSGQVVGNAFVMVLR